MAKKDRPARRGGFGVIILLLVIDIALLAWILVSRSEMKDAERRQQYAGYSGAAIAAADALRS